MLRRALLLAFAAAVAAGCEKEPAAIGALPDTAGYPTPSAATGAYLDALIARDWRRVCATRPAEQNREMARLGGSCEKAFERMFDGQPLDIFQGAKPSAERVRGNVAAVDFTHPGQAEVAITIYARRTAGGWLASDEPDDAAP